MKNVMKVICITIAILAFAKFGYLAWDFLFNDGMKYAVNPIARGLWICKYGVIAIFGIIASCLVDWFWEITKVEGR